MPITLLGAARAALVAAAALSVTACTMFESDRPMFDPSVGAPVYGAAPALVRWTVNAPDADPKTIRLDATFANGEYVMLARGKDKAQWRESLHSTPAPEAPAGSSGTWYVQQIAYADDPEPTDVTYYYDLVRADGTVGGEAIIDQDGHGFLLGATLPELPADQTYQLWGVIGDQVISLGVLGNNPEIELFSAGAPVSQLVVTIERAGGVVSNGNPEGAFAGTLA